MMTKLVVAQWLSLPKSCVFKQIDQMKDSSEIEEESSHLLKRILTALFKPKLQYQEEELLLQIQHLNSLHKSNLKDHQREVLKTHLSNLKK